MFSRIFALHFAIHPLVGRVDYTISWRLRGLFLVSGILVSSICVGAEFRIDFEGTFTECFTCEGTELESLIGTDFSRHVIYDDNVSDTDPDPNRGRYFDLERLFTMSLDAAGEEFDINGNPQLHVRNDLQRGPPDDVVEYQFVDLVTFTAIPDSLFELAFYSGSNETSTITALESDAIPTLDELASLETRAFVISRAGSFGYVQGDLTGFQVEPISLAFAVPALDRVMMMFLGFGLVVTGSYLRQARLAIAGG